MIITDLGPQRCEVERAGHPKRSGQGTAALRLIQADRVTVQVSAASGQPSPRVGHGHAVLGHHADQLYGGRAGAAADAGANR